MSTSKETVDYLLKMLGDDKRFSTRSMFGEYALYADQKVVGLVCNDQLYVKILPASDKLMDVCEQDSPYPGAKKYYLVEESQLQRIPDLPDILFSVASSLPIPRKKKSKKGAKSK